MGNTDSALMTWIILLMALLCGCLLIGLFVGIGIRLALGTRIRRRTSTDLPQSWDYSGVIRGALHGDDIVEVNKDPYLQTRRYGTIYGRTNAPS